MGGGEFFLLGFSFDFFFFFFLVAWGFFCFALVELGQGRSCVDALRLARFSLFHIRICQLPPLPATRHPPSYFLFLFLSLPSVPAVFLRSFAFFHLPPLPDPNPDLPNLNLPSYLPSYIPD
jgi:hypothetical protein